MPRAIVHETLGFTSAGGTSVTTGGAHAKGSWVSLGTPGASWQEFDVALMASASTVRWVFDISIGASNDIIVSNVFAFPGAVVPFRVRLPVFLPAGVEVFVRAQASSATQVGIFALRGAKTFPGGTGAHRGAEAINIDLASTRPAAGNVPLDNSWAEISASLSREYRAFLFSVTDNGTSPVTSQTASVALGAGASGSEAELSRLLARITAGTAAIIGPPALVETPLAAGQRLVARAQATTTGDNLRVPVMGLY